MRQVLAAAAALVLLFATSVRAEVQITSTHYGALTYGLPLAVAKAKGYFEEEGVDVSEILSGKGGATAVRNALAADFKYGEAGIPAILAARRTGLDLVIVNINTASHGDIGWVTKKGAPYTTLESLRGQTVTYTNPKSGSETNLREIMKVSGVDMNAVAAGGMREGLTMVATDAAAAAPVVEPILSMQSDKFDIVFWVGDHLPRMAGVVGFAPRDFAEANADAIRAIIRARRKAVQFMRDDPAGAAEAAVAAGYKYPVEVLEPVIRRLSADGFWSEGALDMSVLEPNVPQLITVGAIEGDSVDWSSVLVQDYLPDDLKN